MAVPPLLAGLPGGDPPDRSSHLLAGYGLAAVPYVWVLARWRDLAPGARGLASLIAVALVARASLLALPPLLSEDLWRYLWDGAVQWAGTNPYRFAPDDAALDGVAAGSAGLEAVRARIGHAHIPTIYPPAAQLVFAAVWAVAPSDHGVRALAIGADGVTIGALWAWLAARGHDPRRAALYAFAPLAVVETGVGGHVDAVGVAALTVAGALFARRRPVRAGIALAASIATKLAPVLALPFLLRRSRAALLACLAALLLVSAPYLSAGSDLLDGLSAYGHRWRGNDGAFAVLAWPGERLLDDVEGPLRPPSMVAGVIRGLVGELPGSPPGDIWPDELSLAVAKVLAGALFLVVFGRLLLRADRFERFLGPTLATAMLLAPVVHPWYLLWLLPLLVLALADGARWAWPVLLWTLLIWLAYVPRADYLRHGRWVESPWIAAAEYLPVWLGLAGVGLSALKRRREGTDVAAPRRPDIEG